MSDISLLSRLVNGVQRHVDLSQNSLIVGSLKVGSSSPTELTKIILNNLVTLQDGSDVGSLHTHDGRYFTETELSSTGATSGADRIGTNNTPVNYSPAVATVQDHLEAIDSALASAGGSEFSDADFRLQDDVDPTKQLAFEVSGITTGTTRTVTMPDANVNLADANNAILKDGSRAFTAAQSMGGFKLTSLANGTASGDAVNYSQLLAVQSIIQNFEWQDSALSIELDSSNIVGPSTGDRYLIAGTGLNDFATHDNEIAEWDGADWVFTSPSVGMFISVDDEANALYYFGGSSWAAKYFESTTASTGLVKVGFDVRLDASAAGDGLGFSSGVLSVNVDNSSLEINTNTLRVKASGIGINEISTAIAGNGLSGGGGSALAVNVDNSSIEINSDALRLKTSGTTATHLNTNVADQSTITGGGGSALAVQHAPKIQTIEVANESLAATTLWALRYAKAADAGFVAGRVSKADIDASSVDNFYVSGLAYMPGSVSVGGSVTMVQLGLLNVPSHGFTVGAPLFLDASGAVTETAPTASNMAVVKVGMVKDANNINVQIQVVGVN